MKPTKRNNMRPYKVLFILSIFISSSCILSAQRELQSENIEVIKDFDARLIDTRKLKIQPKLPPIDTAKRTYDYDVSIQEFQVSYDSPVLRPLAMLSESTPTGYRNYARAGYGKPNAILGNAGLYYTNDGLFEIGLNGHYQSANNKSFEDQKFSEAGGELAGKYYFTDYLAIGGALNYDRDEYYMYGYDHEITVGPELKNDKRLFNTIGFKAEIFNPERTEGGFDYTGSIQLIRKKDQLDLSENGALIDVKGTKWINGKNPFSIQVRADLSKFNTENNDQSLNNFFVKPSWTIGKPSLQIKAGVEVAMANDEVFFFPDLQVSLKLLENKLIPFIGWKGTMEKNNFTNITDYNPFALILPSQINNQHSQHYFAGVKGEIKGITYQGKAGYKTFKNLALFERNIVDERRFDVVYDDGSAIVISGVVSAQVLKNLSAGATAYKNFYNLDLNEKAWHLPGFEMSIFAHYTGLDKRLSIRPELNIMDGVPYRNINNETDRLNSLLDVSVQAEYYLFEKVGLFVHANNLTSNNRERWQQYPTYGLNIIGGVSVRF
jgi:hypothetical protein